MNDAERAEAQEMLALHRALRAVMGRREELFEIVVGSNSESEATAAVARYFGMAVLHAGAALSLSVAKWTVDGQRRISDDIEHTETLLALDDQS